MTPAETKIWRRDRSDDDASISFLLWDCDNSDDDTDDADDDVDEVGIDFVEENCNPSMQDDAVSSSITMISSKNNMLQHLAFFRFEW